MNATSHSSCIRFLPSHFQNSSLAAAAAAEHHSDSTGAGYYTNSSVAVAAAGTTAKHPANLAFGLAPAVRNRYNILCGYWSAENGDCNDCDADCGCDVKSTTAVGQREERVGSMCCSERGESGWG